MIDPIGPGPGAPVTGDLRPAATPDAGAAFLTALEARIERVGELARDAGTATRAAASAPIDDLEHVLVAARKADVAFGMLIEVRAAVVRAYDELRGMNV